MRILDKLDNLGTLSFDTVVVYICHDIFNFIQIGFGQAV